MTRLLPILPLRDIVVFPQRIVPLFVGREKSVAALEAAMSADKELFLSPSSIRARMIPIATLFTISA